MRTAVSIPDDLVARVDRLARDSHRSRNEFYVAAVREYLARHGTDAITADLDAVLADIVQQAPERFIARASRQTTGRSGW